MTNISDLLEENCTHHWIIATPQGDISNGTCKHCNAVRVFANSDENSVWEGGTFRHSAKNDQVLPTLVNDIKF